MLSLPLLALLAFQRAEADPTKEILALAEDLNPEVRADAARRLAELEPAALPFLEKALGSGNLKQARLVVLAGEVAPESSAWREILLRAFRRPSDRSLLPGLAFALASHPDDEVRRALAEVAIDAAGEPLVRVAATLSLARTGPGAAAEEMRKALVAEPVPPVAGALALALGLAGDEASIAAIEARLAAEGNATVRAGLLLALAVLGRRGRPTASDLGADDAVLPLAAALHCADEPLEGPLAAAWQRAIASDDSGLRAAAYAALALGHEPRSLARLGRGASVELHRRVRAAVYGSAAARGDLPTLRARRATADDRAALFAALAGFVRGSAERAKAIAEDLLPEAARCLETPRGSDAAAAALLVAAAGFSGAEESLLRWERAGSADASVASLARKFLRREVDLRALEDAIRRVAFDQGVSYESLVAEGLRRYALVTVGSGSDFFHRRRDFPAGNNRSGPAPGRSLPRDSPIYEDLWLLLARRPPAERLRPRRRRAR